VSDALLASSFLPLITAFSDCFTRPSFETFQHLVAGWVLCLGRHTVTGVLKAAGAVGPKHKHHSCFHRFFNIAAWSMEDVSLALVRLVLALVPAQQGILVAVDDTLGHHTGKHIRGASMHRDELLSTRAKVVFHWGHVWVVLAVVVYVPLCRKHFALPVLWRLYRSVKLCKKERRAFLKKTEMAALMVGTLAGAIPERKVTVLGDAAYANASVLKALPPNVDFIGRSRLDAAVYAVPAPQRRGRPRIKGDRVPSPGARAKSGRGWSKLRVEVYGKKATVQVKVFDALWYVVAGGRLLRFVLIRGWPGHENDDVLVTTDVQLSARDIIQRYCLRWKLEVTFEDAKGKLGFEDPQNRTDKAVDRTAPMALLTYSLAVIWYATAGHRSAGARLPQFPWYAKTVPTFSDILAALRREAWRERFLDPVRPNRRLQKSLAPLVDAAAAAG
jgi:DDE superfamily endonuclease